MKRATFPLLLPTGFTGVSPFSAHFSSFLTFLIFRTVFVPFSTILWENQGGNGEVRNCSKLLKTAQGGDKYQLYSPFLALRGALFSAGFPPILPKNGDKTRLVVPHSSNINGDKTRLVVPSFPKNGG